MHIYILASALFPWPDEEEEEEKEEYKKQAKKIVFKTNSVKFVCLFIII